MAQLYRTLTGQSNKSATSTSTATPGARDANLVRTATDPLNPLKGRLNHLSPTENERLEQFRVKLREQGWWTPDGVNGKPSHDDATLLRYLRARKFVVDDAIGQFTDTEKWMKENKVEDLYQEIDIEFYERARRMYPQWTGRRDRRGIPIYVFEIKGLDSKNVSKYQKESESFKAKLPHHKDLSVAPKLLPLFALYQNLLNFVLPLCSTLERPNPEIPVTNSTNIVDISGVGLGQFWNLKQHMQDASVLATAHYPETLDRIFIIGAPAFFPTVWSWIKRWFDPVTVSKIFILGKNEVKPTLESFMDPENFPKKYGGTLDWGWGDLPDLGTEERAAVGGKDGSSDWIPGPCMWLQGRRIPVGTNNGQARTDKNEVDALRPVTFAADKSDVPVHGGNAQKTTPAANGKPTDTSEPDNKSHAPATAAVTTTEKLIPEPQAQPTSTQDTSGLNIRNSPMGDSQVHLPEAQAAPPAQTAEYITPATAAAAAAAAAANNKTATTTTTTSPAESKPPTTTTTQPPAGHTQPGPLTQHNVEINKAIATKLEGESISTLPASSGENGDLPHPEVTISSDPSKGLAAETEKLELGEQQNGRPTIDRFVTATEIKPAS